MIHSLHVFHALAFEPAADFVWRDDRGTSPAGDLHHVGNVIAVPMREENEIGGYLLDVDLRGEGIRGDEWIEEERLAAGDDGETSVAVVGEFHGLKVFAAKRFVACLCDTTLRAIEASNVRSFLRYWLPVLAWMLLIFVASTDLMSAQHTSRFIGPFLRWLIPDISPETIRSVQFAIRKAAHVTEYAILAALFLRAFTAAAGRLRRRDAFLAVVFASAYAALDEYHQSFVASRTGSPFDVLIDASGALLGVMICWWVINGACRRGRAKQRHERPAADRSS